MGLSCNVNIIIISCVFSALAFISVSLRFYGKSLKRTRFGADVSLILPALVKERPHSLLSYWILTAFQAFVGGMGITNITAALHGGLEDEMPMNEQGGLGSNHSTTIFLQVRPHWIGTNPNIQTT